MLRKYKNTTNAIKDTLLSEYGILITLDGINGMGQRQVMKNCKKMFKQKNIPTVFINEPIYTKSSQIITSINKRKNDMRKIIIPALKQHKLVICNHFVMDDMAYLGNYYVASNPNWFWTDWSDGHPHERMHQKICDLNTILKRNRKDIDWGKREPKGMYKAYYNEPDLCLFFDTYPYNQKNVNLYNKRNHAHMTLKRFQKLERSYDFALKQYQHGFVILDCAESFDSITKQAITAINDLLHNEGDDTQTPFSLNNRLIYTNWPL